MHARWDNTCNVSLLAAVVNKQALLISTGIQMHMNAQVGHC